MRFEFRAPQFSRSKFPVESSTVSCNANAELQEKGSIEIKLQENCFLSSVLQEKGSIKIKLQENCFFEFSHFKVRAPRKIQDEIIAPMVLKLPVDSSTHSEKSKLRAPMFFEISPLRSRKN